MNLIDRLSETHKKLILWGTVACVAGALLGWWVMDVQQRVQALQGERNQADESIEALRNQFIE